VSCSLKVRQALVKCARFLSVNDDDAAVLLDKKLEQVEKYFAKHEINYTMEMVEGENLASVTMKQAKKRKSDLIVIMTEQEDNFGGIFLGPYAQQIVNHSKIPVMSINYSILLISECFIIEFYLICCLN
jgi:nucleotide-binding universal stress UspA family protein